MKKILATLMTLIVVFSMFSIFAPQAKAETTPIAWKDETSFGLENEHLLLYGDYQHYSRGISWFKYLVFKDTGTKWTSPWDDIFLLYAPDMYFADVGSIQIETITEIDEAKIVYHADIPYGPYVLSGPIHIELIISIRDGPYIYWTAKVTNTDLIQKTIPIGLSLYTFIAGDTANDYYYVPGHGQGQFVGTQMNLEYYPTESWVAVWDQSKQEGAGVINTKGFTVPHVIISDWYGLTAVPEMVHFVGETTLEAGQTSQIFDQYLYFFTGTGWEKTKTFYDSLTKVEVTKYEITNVYETDKMGTFFSYLLKKKRRPIQVTVDVYVAGDQFVDHVYLKLWCASWSPPEITAKMVKKEPSHYSLEMGAPKPEPSWDDLMDMTFFALDLVMSYFGYSLAPPPWYSQPPTYPDVILKEIVIVDTDGNEHVEMAGDRLPTYYDAIPIKLPTWSQSGGGIYAVMCPVDLLVTSPDGYRVGVLYENGTFIREVNELPDAFYTGRNFTLELITVPFETGYYDIQVHGTGDGEYNLTTLFFNYVSFYSVSNAIKDGENHYYTLSVSEAETSLVSWEYIFEDLERDTMLKLSIDDKYFQFVAPVKEFSIKEAGRMKIRKHSIFIWHKDEEIKLVTIAVDTRIDFCFAYATDMETGEEYLLIDKPGTE